MAQLEGGGGGGGDDRGDDVTVDPSSGGGLAQPDLSPGDGSGDGGGTDDGDSPDFPTPDRSSDDFADRETDTPTTPEDDSVGPGYRTEVGTPSTPEGPDELTGSDDPRYREDVFDSPHEQERFRRQVEQQLRDEYGPGVEVAPGGLFFTQTAGGYDVGFRTGAVSGADIEAAEAAARQAAREQVASQSPLVQPNDVVFQQRDGGTVATVDRETAELLAMIGYGQGGTRVDPSSGGGLARPDLPVRGDPADQPGRTVDLRALGGDPANQPLTEAQIAQAEGQVARETGLDPGTDFSVDRFGNVELTSEGRIELAGRPESQISSRVEQQVEQAVGQQRAKTAGIVNPTLRAGAVANVDLERGEDFTIRLSQGEVGVQASAELTESRARAEAEHALEQVIYRQTGTALEAGEDFRVVEGEDGDYRAELTESGETQLDTGPLSEFVADVEDTLGIDVWGEGPAASDTRAQRDLGQVNVVLQQFGDRPTTPGPGAAPRERVGTSTLEAEIESTLADIDELVEPQDTAIEATQPTRGRAGAAARLEQRNFQTGQAELAQLFVERTAEAPATLPVAGVKMIKDAGEFSGAVLGATARGDLDRVSQLYRDLGQTGVNVAATGASRVIESPARTAVGGLGTLAGSALLFGGAAAIGSRTSLATRALVQPGEEALGFGGYGITRRVASERSAERYFPNREPLIFSEEAAIRGVRRAARGGQRLSRRITVEPRAFGAGPPKLRMKTELETEIDEELRRMERAQAADVPLNPDVDFRGAFVNTRTGQVETKTPIETGRELEEEATRPRLEARTQAESLGLAGGATASDARVAVEARAEQMARGTGREDVLLDQLQETDVELGLELGTETEVRSRAEARAEAEAETEAELETEFELESELEAEVQADEREAVMPWEGGEGALPSDVGGEDTPLAAGYFAEFLSAYAGNVGPRETPSRAELEELNVGTAEFTGELPTAAILEGGEEIEAAEELFFAGDGEDDDFL